MEYNTDHFLSMLAKMNISLSDKQLQQFTGAARTAKRLERNVQRIADAQQQLEIDLHIVAADNAVERLRRHFDLPRELVDLDLAFIQQIFERGSDHTQHLFGLIITNLPFYVKE